MQDVLSALLLLTLIAGVAAVFAGLERRRRARLAAQEAWRQQAVAALRLTDGQAGHLAVVEHVYQRARTGAKAIIIWDATGIRQDAWFSRWPNVPAGAYLVLAGKTGYGPHNHNPSVYYVAPNQVLTVV